MEEIWRDIKGYENYYKVSNFGRIKSLNYNGTGKERLLKGGKDGNGYLQINLWKKGNPKPKHISIHRLVAEAFIPNPDNLPQVNHKDEDKTNNVVSNLEWCSAEYNINYGSHNEKVAKSNGSVICQYTKDGQFIKEYNSTREAEKQTGIYHIGIIRCCNGGYVDKRTDKWININQSGGYIWKYKKED